jgi:hypothetical protein
VLPAECRPCLVRAFDQLKCENVNAFRDLEDYSMPRNSMVAALSSVLIASLTPVFFFAQSEDPAVRVTVPRTNPAIMVDGVFSSGEWNSAAKVELPQVANIYFQTSAEFVYIAVEFTRSPSGMVDLFVSPANGQVYDLHASAKRGERQLNRSGYPEWVWWTNRDWTANVSRADSFEKPTFLPTRVREFQLRRARFAEIAGVFALNSPR